MTSQTITRDAITEVVHANGAQPGAMLPVLHALQEQFGYVPTAATSVIADALNVSRAEVHGVVTFYHHFRTALPGRYVVQVCRAEACQAVGARALEAHVFGALGCGYGDTTADGAITLEPVYCLGNCACGPSVLVGEELIGRVDAERFDAIVAELRVAESEAQP